MVENQSKDMAAVRGVNAGNYAAAGNAASDNFVNTVRAARDYSPKYDKIAIEGIKGRSAEKRAAMEADAKVAEAGIKAEAHIRKTKYKIDELKSYGKAKKAERKAGVVAAAGALIGDAFKKEREPFQPDWSLQEEYLNRQQGRIDKQSEVLNDPNLGLTPPAPYKPTVTSDDDSTSPPSSSVPEAPKPGGSSGKSSLLPHQKKGLAAIRRVESDAFGAYEAFNLGGITEFDPVGSGNSSSGHFGKPLTQMTIGEIRALGNSGKIHATGAYQFTHNTGSFGEAVQFAGLSDSDVFTPENQDKMALAFGQKYGWDRWSGLKKDAQARADAIAGFK